MILVTAATESGSSTGFLVFVLVALLLWWLASAASGRRRSRVCERYGHVPDADTIGSWNERCARCGTRLR